MPGHLRQKIVTGCGEKGTSKTCTKCGFWKNVRVQNKKCSLKIDRDVNGARNNLLEKLQELIVNDVRQVGLRPRVN